MDSPTSSVISVVSVPSSVSGLESVVDVGPTLDKGQIHVSHLTDKQSSNFPTTSIVPEYNGKPAFAAGDGDFRLWVGEACFETHKYLLKRFKVLEDIILEQPSCAAIRLTDTRPDAEDFTRMFNILYASLEQTTLSAIERIKIAREFGLRSWEEPAYLELCDRDDPITIDEASVLGMDVFVRVAGIREREQRRRGKEVDAPVKGQGVGCLGTAMEEKSSDSEQGNPDDLHTSRLEGPTVGQIEDKHKEVNVEAEMQDSEGTSSS